MKRKIIGICICTLLMTTGVITLADTERRTPSNVIEESDCGCSEKIYNLRIFPPTVMTEPPQFSAGEDVASHIALIDTPEYFNWMDYEGKDWTSPVKNQWNCGSCWDFAANGALESVLNIREGIADLDPDLSEQYVLSCLPSAGSCAGGDAYLTFKYIRSNTSQGNYCNGTILESCFPYRGNDTVSCDEKCENWEDYLIPILNYGMIAATQPELIKSTIMQKGPIAALVVVDSNFSLWSITHHSPNDYYPYIPMTLPHNHLIVIVGWKDDPAIGKGGYYICKNSWGPLMGYNGFFNVEYEGLRINAGWMCWVDYDPSSYDWHPVPKIYGPYYGLINQPVQFKGNVSGEHPPFTWLWDFGDGTYSEDQNPTHMYLSPGAYNVTATVTDANNKSFSETTSAWVQETNHPPEKPVITGPQKVKKGEWVWYNITVNDSDGTIIYLDWEIFNITPGLWDGPYPSNMELPAYGQWNEKGSFTVRVKAKDPYGAESEWATLTVRVPFSFNTLPPSFWEQLFERFPNAFPILRHLLGY